MKLELREAGSQAGAWEPDNLTQIQQIVQLEMLVKLLTTRSAHQLIYGNYAKNVRVSIDTNHEKSIGPALNYFQKQLDAPFAFQIVIDADYVDADCFARVGGPVVVPARTLLSQLL